MLGLQLKDGASLCISDCSAGRDGGGGFISMGDLLLQDSLHSKNVGSFANFCFGTQATLMFS